jgi:BirA family biotin operon repressor/biotin-[acetyl-CoA-carboxylase] ligase
LLMLPGQVDLIKVFLDKPAAFIPGRRLCELLNVSRVTVWNRLQALQEGGFTFEARKQRGYRLVTLPTALCGDLIQAYLATRGYRLAHLSCHASIDSTNSEAERLLARPEPSVPLAVVASEQTAGRGRLGRRWESPPAGNIYLSVGFRPLIPPDRLSLLTVWTALRLVETLQRHYPAAPFRLKWPNDLLLGEAKLAGLLTEARIDSFLTRDVILGLGINVSTAPELKEGSPGRSAGCLASLAPPLPNLNLLTADLIETLMAAFAETMTGIRGETLMERWEPLDALKGSSVSFLHKGVASEGVARGIDERGRLLVQRDGQTFAVESGEVEKIKCP